MTVVLAGHETTAIALSWTFYLLGENPETETNLTAELEEVLDGRAATVRDLPRLRYADAVIKESMRLYPPAWAIGREALGDCEIGGYHVPTKTQMFISQYVTHRDPRFFDRPDDFDPSRWYDGRTDHLPPYAYFRSGRTEDVHRQLRQDGGRAAARDDSARVPPRARNRRTTGPPAFDHAAPQRGIRMKLSKR